MHFSLKSPNPTTTALFKVNKMQAYIAKFIKCKLQGCSVQQLYVYSYIHTPNYKCTTTVNKLEVKGRTKGRERERVSI